MELLHEVAEFLSYSHTLAGPRACASTLTLSDYESQRKGSRLKVAAYCYFSYRREGVERMSKRAAMFAAGTKGALAGLVGTAALSVATSVVTDVIGLQVQVPAKTKSRAACQLPLTRLLGCNAHTQ